MKKRWKRLISILLMCCMVVGLLPTTSLAITTESPDVAILSGAAKYDEENGYWVLTPDYTMESSGAMWLTSLVEGDFTLDLEYYTGSSDRPLGGADGITVAFWAEYGYTLPNGADMGFTGSQGYGIELDTYYSGNNRYFDPQYNHIGLVKESSRNHIATAPLPESEDEQWHKLKIVVKDNICSAYVDGTLKLQNEVTPTGHNWLGITAATHSGTNLHAVRNMHLTAAGPESDKKLVDLRLSHELIADTNGEYTYQITATMQNNAKAAAQDVTLSLEADPLLTLSDDSTKDVGVGTVDIGQSKTATWLVNTPWPEQNQGITYRVIADIAHTTATLNQESYIYLRAKNEFDNRIKFGTDQWQFSNSDSNYHSDQYYMTDDDYKNLLSNIGFARRNNIELQKREVPGGSCYGMSVAAILTKENIINPTNLPGNEGTICLHDIKLNDRTESLINFYYLQQFTTAAMNTRSNFSIKSTQEELKILEEKVSKVSTGGTPVQLSFYGSKGGHAVVAYDVEKNKQGWWFIRPQNGYAPVKYDSRIVIYDCNFPNKARYLYYNAGTSQWYDPDYKWATKLTRANDDIAVMDAVNYHNATANAYAQLRFENGMNEYYLVEDNVATHIDSSTDLREQGIISYYDDNALIDGTVVHSPLNLVLPSLDKAYSVRPAESGEFTVGLTYANIDLSADVDDAKQINFAPDGSISAEGVSGEYSLEFDANEGYSPLPWYSIAISGNDSEDVSLKQTDEGMAIQGDNLQDVTVIVMDAENTKELTFTTDQDEVLLDSMTIGTEEQPVIKIDANSDGVFETVIDNSETLTLNRSELNLSVGESFALQATVGTKTDSTSDVKWNSDNESVAKVQDGVVTAIAVGTAKITATVGTGETEKRATCTVQVNPNNNSSNNSGGSSGGGGGSSSSSYAISAPSVENGKISVSPSTAKKGDTVTISVTPDTGYKLDKLTVTDSKGNTLTVSNKGNGKYTFTMPDSKVTVTPIFVPEATKPAETRFVDVADNAWYAEAVNYVADKGMMNGIGENKFAPNATTTRAMLMTVLARYAGQDTSDSNPWYQKGMDWAVNQKVSDGTNPTANITREQLVTMLYRYAGSPVANGSLSDFSDTAAISDYAVSAMQWAVANSIVNGANGNLNPKNNATRAEVAAILMRFCEMNQ